MILAYRGRGLGDLMTFFETGCSYIVCVVQAELELMILLPQPPSAEIISVPWLNGICFMSHL
jgi:hypothetical protein